MYLSIPKQNKLVNLERYDTVVITVSDEEKGLYQLCAVRMSSHLCEAMENLTAPSSLDHAKKQLSNILRSLSNGVKICRVYDEDEPITPNEENTT